jgi:hypothetical protein
MKYERHGLLLPEPTQTAVDHELKRSFESAHLGARETFKDLEVSAERQQAIEDAWHNGEDASLLTEHLDEDELIQRLQELQEWKTELLARDDIESSLMQVYRWRVNENIARIHMLIASKNGDMDNFHRYNEFIYGKPDEDIYRAALDWVAHDAEMLLANPDTELAPKEAATKVLGMLRDKRGYRELLVPEKDTFQAVRDNHLRPGGYYALLLAGVEVPESGKINNALGDPILKHVIKENLQSDYVIVDAKGASWGMSHSVAAVERPAVYDMPMQRFFGLGVGHEIGSHLLERMNGLRGPIELAAGGLDRTEAGNEGRAVIREQVQYETFDEFGKLVRWRDILRRHIAISYASGVGEDSLKTSSETYAFMNMIDTMYQARLKPNDSEELIKEKAQVKTDNLLLRELKGTDGKGGAGLKDKVYLEGHVASWLTAAIHGPERISEGDLGKFDINNARHVTFLQQWGLLPDNRE